MAGWLDGINGKKQHLEKIPFLRGHFLNLTCVMLKAKSEIRLRQRSSEWELKSFTLIWSLSPGSHLSSHVALFCGVVGRFMRMCVCLTISNPQALKPLSHLADVS